MQSESYEQKILAILARFRGQEITSQTLFEMEGACEKEVWAHLPKRIRDAWSLKLAFSDEAPGRIDLCPRKHGDVAPEELEAALRAPFEDRSNGGGMASLGFGFSGDVTQPEPIAPVVVPAAAPTAAGSLATDISEQARALGIQLPPNSSLLQPFLEALTLAVEYKERAEVAEAKLAELQKLLGR